MAVEVPVKQRGVQQESTKSPFIPVRPRLTHAGRGFPTSDDPPVDPNEAPAGKRVEGCGNEGSRSWSNGRHTGLSDLRTERGERETERKRKERLSWLGS